MSSIAEDMSRARAALRKGRKVFLRQDHRRGFLHEMASWRGEYHLAHVHEGYDASTGRFQARWQRRGRHAVITCALRSADQIMPLEGRMVHSMEVQVEDDENGNVHCARIADLCEGRPGEVRVRWDRGDEGMVCVSQVSFGRRGRTRARREAGASATKAKTASKKRRAEPAYHGNHTKRSRRKIGGGEREEDVEVISIPSSSSEEKEEKGGRKVPPSSTEEEHGRRNRPWNAGSNGESQASPVDQSRVSRPEAANKLDGTQEKHGNNETNQDVEAVEAMQGGGNSEDDADDLSVARDGVSEESNVSSIDFPPSMVICEGAAASITGEGAARPSIAAAESSRSGDSDAAFVEGLLTQESSAVPFGRNEKVAASESAACGSSMAGSLHPNKGEMAGAREVVAEEGKASSLSPDELPLTQGSAAGLPGMERDAAVPGGAARRRPAEGMLHTGGGGAVERGTPMEEGTASSLSSDKPLDKPLRGKAAGAHEMFMEEGTASSLSSDEPLKEPLVSGDISLASNWLVRKGTTLEAAKDGTSRSANGARRVLRERPVTPRKDTIVSPSVNEDDGSANRDGDPVKASKEDGILLHGFCRLITPMRDSSHMVKAVKNLLGKSLECEKDSKEFRETLVDANMLLQESLYNLNERTKLVKAPNIDNVGGECSNESKNDGNKTHIFRLAKRLGLTRRQVASLFSRLNVNDGFYSINDAIPVILEMKTVSGAATQEPSNDEEDESLGGTNSEGQKEQLELLGSRVKTVLEDGKEYEGTISTIHYRVTYDDGDTETFVSEAEAFENLACNDRYLNGTLDGEMRCSALEIFSGCSLLSTLCKRKGMNVMSIDNDILDSNATVKADFSSDYVQSLLSSQVFDYIHASPVCSTYSHLAGGKHRNDHCYNRTREAHEADAMLMMLYLYIEKALNINGSMTVTIENPRAWMRKGNIMKELFEGKLGFKRFEIHYCQFGRADQKPTNIWTNDQRLGKILEAIGGKCRCAKPHEEGVKKAKDKNYAALPLKLCQLISTYIQSKHTQLKFEKLAASGGACSKMLNF